MCVSRVATARVSRQWWCGGGAKTAKDVGVVVGSVGDFRGFDRGLAVHEAQVAGHSLKLPRY